MRNIYIQKIHGKEQEIYSHPSSFSRSTRPCYGAIWKRLTTFPRASRYGGIIAPLIAILVISVPAFGDLPTIPPGDISPLYGRWRNAQGRDQDIMTIGPKWLTTFHGVCPRRIRYRLVSKAVPHADGPALLEITLEMHDAEFVGAKAKENCSDLDLPSDYFLRINLMDDGSPADAPVMAFSWEACDTLEHLNEPVNSANFSVRSCGAGGGIMDRIEKRH